MLIQRIVTGSIFVAVVVISVLWLPSLWSGIILGALWLLGVREWGAGFAKLDSVGTGIYVVVFAAAMAAAAVVTADSSIYVATLVVALLWWVAAVFAVATYPHQISRSTTLVAGVATLLPAWMLLEFLHEEVPRGRELVLMLLLIVWCADIGAFVVGRTCGRLKLAPNVSPGKTWEGAIGGVGSGALIGWAGSHVLGLAPLPFFALALATAMSSVVGDLTVSMFKRNVGLKDSGQLLPGHGGILDRVDSLTSAAAVYALGLALIGVES